MVTWNYLVLLRQGLLYPMVHAVCICWLSFYLQITLLKQQIRILEVGFINQILKRNIHKPLAAMVSFIGLLVSLLVLVLCVRCCTS